MKIIKICIVSNIGMFVFSEHHSAKGTNFYNAMLQFEGNNWNMLGEYHYEVVLEHPDGTTTNHTFDGINASANLANFIEDCFIGSQTEIYADSNKFIVDDGHIWAILSNDFAQAVFNNETSNVELYEVWNDNQQYLNSHIENLDQLNAAIDFNDRKICVYLGTVNNN